MNEENTVFKISELLTGNFADFPKEVKPLSTREKRWILQRCIFNILKQEDMRLANRKRYNEFLKANKYRHNSQSMEKWLACKDKQFKKMKPIPEKTFGIFSSKLNETQLFRVQSECQDLLNRKESPNIFIWGLRTRKI